MGLLDELVTTSLRAAIIPALALVCLAGTCGGDMEKIGGDWLIVDVAKLPESSAPQRDLYRDRGGGRVLVDTLLQQWRFYDPDCVVYETSRSSAPHAVLAVCGERVPVLVESSLVARWSFEADGIHRTLPPEMRGGRATSVVEEIPFAEIRAAAEAQPPFRENWTSGASRLPTHQKVEPARSDDPARPQLFDAAAEGRADLVDGLLRGGADVNARNDSGGTALIAAASQGHVDVLRRLIEARADLNAADKSGRTALIYAARARQKEAVRILLAAGADATLRDDGGKTAADHARGTSDAELLRMLER